MEQHFYTSVKPLVIFFVILGLLPYYSKNKKMYTSRFNAAYVALLIAMYLIVLYDAFNVEGRKIPQTSATSMNILKTVNIVQTITTFINTIMRRKRFIKLSKAMLKCEDAFKEIMNISKKRFTEKYIRIWQYLLLW